MSETEEIQKAQERLPESHLAARLRTVDTIIAGMIGVSYRDQVAIGALATAMAMRRFLKAVPLDRGQRHRVLKAAVHEFEEKLRQYGEPLEVKENGQSLDGNVPSSDRDGEGSGGRS